MTNSEVKKLFARYMIPKKSGDHAVLSASGSERWLGCAGSVRLSEGITSVESDAAVTGTNAHTLLQFILENHKDHLELLDHPLAKKFLEFISYSEEQHDSVMVAVRYVTAEYERMYKETGIKPTLLIEQRVELKGVGHGTADVILYQPFGLLHVIDYKNGKSVVEPKGNTQGLYYASATADKFGWDFDRLHITIIQPNASHADGPIRTWKTDYKRLQQGKTMLIEGAKRTKDPDAPLVMNHKYCYFCPAREKVCPLHKEIRTAKIMERFRRD